MTIKSVLLILLNSFALAALGQPARLWTEKDRAFLVENLQRVQQAVFAETKNLSPAQWSFREDPSRWSIVEIVEHLAIHDEFTGNEIWGCLNQPPTTQFVADAAGNDAVFLDYANDPLKADAGGLSPYGKFCDPAHTLTVYEKATMGLLSLVKTSDKDFRKHFTFRNFKPDGHLSHAEKYNVRDMHQRALTIIAHTDRHLKQLKKVKMHLNYPK